jgi:hypothetical protein
MYELMTDRRGRSHGPCLMLTLIATAPQIISSSDSNTCQFLTARASRAGLRGDSFTLFLKSGTNGTPSSSRAGRPGWCFSPGRPLSGGGRSRSRSWASSSSATPCSVTSGRCRPGSTGGGRPWPSPGWRSGSSGCWPGPPPRGRRDAAASRRAGQARRPAGADTAGPITQGPAAGQAVLSQHSGSSASMRTSNSTATRGNFAARRG